MWDLLNYFYGMDILGTCWEVICQEATNNLPSFVCTTATFIDFINYFTPTSVDKRRKMNENKRFNNFLSVLKYSD